MKKSMKKSVFLITVFSVLMLLFAGCSNSSGGSSGNNNDDDVIDNDNTDKTSGSETVGSTGGIVTAGNNVTITIPDGALDTDTIITVNYYDKEENVAKGPSDFLGGVEFGPDGTVFNTPVEVKMKLTDKASATSISVFCYDKEEDIWDFVTAATVEDGYAIFTVNHFSIYELQDKIPASSQLFSGWVNEALANGYSDDWVMDQWMKYVIEEEKVLDHLKWYDGYWFEPCGISMNGDYYVNGVENKSNMYKEYGHSNKVGNKYGFSMINGTGLSHYEYIKAKNKVTENQQLYHSWIIVDYQMIEPQIELKADKTTLKKGETITVEVYCHYDELPMDNYELELPYILKYFEVDTKKIVTDDNGKATFKLTAIDKGKEYVKVQFYRTGYLTGRAEGIAYSAGDLQFTCGGIDISGHITEVRDSIFDIPAHSGYVETTQKGKLNIQMDYDFEGVLNITDEETGEVEGSITFYNVEVDIDTTSLNFTDYADGYEYCKIILFKTFDSETFDVTCNVRGLLKDNYCELNYDCALEPLLMVEGKTKGWLSIGGVSASEDMDTMFILLVGGDNIPLYNFELKNGTTTKEYAELKDELMTDLYSIDWFTMEYFPEDPSKSQKTLTTTQTISIDM